MMIFVIPASFLNFVCPQVLCPGPWSEDLLKTVGISIPLNPMKIPVYYWRWAKVKSLSFSWPRLPVYLFMKPIQGILDSRCSDPLTTGTWVEETEETLTSIAMQHSDNKLLTWPTFPPGLKETSFHTLLYTRAPPVILHLLLSLDFRKITYHRKREIANSFRP